LQPRTTILRSRWYGVLRSSQAYRGIVPQAIVLLTLLCPASFASQDPRVAQARRLFAAGSYAQASRLLEDSLKTQPGDADIHLLLGQIYAVEERRTESIQQFTRALELRPDSAITYDALGSALNRFAEFDQARKAFEQAVALDPNMAQARVNLAMSLAQAGDATGATEQLETAIQIRPDDANAATAHYLLAKIFTGQDNQRALDELAKAVRIRPGDQEAWIALGQLRRETNDEAGTLAAFQRAVACDPRNPEAQYELGSEYLAQGDARQAVVHLQLARKSMPKVTLAVLYKLDRALRAQGSTTEAQQFRLQAQALLAQDNQVNQHLIESQNLDNEGVALEKQGNVAAALAKYRAAVELNPQHSGFRYNYALALCRLGRWREGIGELNEILHSDPGNIEARRALYIAEDKAKQAAADPPAKPHP
jgi:tetratricopeptide (TPR) repeat protein